MHRVERAQSNTHSAFKTQRYFPRVDGLRAVSVMLVLTIHSEVAELHVLKGYAGVTIFFVISGFLITTLLLREEEKHGRVSLGGFYIRRAFRIFPLYYLALAITTLGVLVGLGENSGNYAQRLIYFLTYTNEFAPGGTFGHSWSLAVEEKFYLIWPALMFTALVIRSFRTWIGASLLTVSALLGLLLPVTYVGMYAPILAGCLLALIAHDARGFNYLIVLAKPGPGLFAIALAIAAVAISPDGFTQVGVGLSVALAFPVLLFGPTWISGWLSTHSLVYVGTRAYAIYLFHPLIGSAAAVVVDPERGLTMQILHLVLMFAGSLIFAEIVFRLVENPLIKVGRNVAGKWSTRKQHHSPEEAPQGRPRSNVLATNYRVEQTDPAKSGFLHTAHVPTAGPVAVQTLQAHQHVDASDRVID